MEFFKNKYESHHIVVLGPTGSSAALINGSTYHSFLGINPGPNTAKEINEVKAKLEGVLTIFSLMKFQCCPVRICIKFLHN
jgi:hypothetical protein